MPLRPERLNNRIRNRLPTLPALRTIPISMAVNAPSIPLLLHKRRATIKRITALRAEEMTNVPLGTTRNHDLALDRRLAAFAARGEHLVEIKMAVEPEGLVAVFGLEALHVFVRGVRVEHGNVFAALARLNAGDALGVFGRGLRIEGDAFEMLAAVVAEEAFWVEADACGRDDASCDG